MRHLLCICALMTAQFAHSRDYATPTRRATPSETPAFRDDIDFADIEIAIGRQLDRYRKRPPKGRIKLGGTFYPLSAAGASLEAFAGLVREFRRCARRRSRERCYETFERSVATTFDVFVPDGGGPAFFTGYHTQHLEGRTRPDGEFIYPVYATPSGPERSASRHEIDFRSKLEGKGLELIYTKSRFDLYLLSVEGGGLVTVREGGKTSRFHLSYSGTNRRKWAWISKYMLDKGYIANSSIAAQRKFLRRNPEMSEAIFASCPSYVFFRKSHEQPVGSDMVPLTDGRSLATDRTLYGFKGLLTFVESERPEENGAYDFEEEDVSKVKHRPFQRFFVDQDTGGAIKGKARADLYFGSGEYAHFAASHMAKTGNIFFLMLKSARAG